MTFRALCMYNGSIHGCVSFNFVESQQLQNSANQNEAPSPLGDFVDICRGDCRHCISRWWQCRGADLTVPSCNPCHIPTLLSVGGSFQSSNLFCTECVLAPVINHHWIAGSVFLCLKRPWTLINVALRSQNNCQRTYAHEKLFQCKRWLCPAPCVSPLSSFLSYSLPGLTWPSANWLWGCRPDGFSRHPWGNESLWQASLLAEEIPAGCWAWDPGFFPCVIWGLLSSFYFYLFCHNGSCASVGRWLNG